MKTLPHGWHTVKSAARKLARLVIYRSDIEAVFYPGLPNHPGREVHEKQSSGYGAVVSFDVGSGERAKAGA